MCRCLVPGVVLAVVALLGITKAPQIQLDAALSSGELDGRPIQVADFVPAPLVGQTVRLRCGPLVFDVPACAEVQAWEPDQTAGYLIMVGGLRCRILPPRVDMDPEHEYLGYPMLARLPGQQEIDRQAAICAADAGDFSYRMSGAEAELLRERLEVRPVLCLGARRIEILRGPSVSGLVLFGPCINRSCVAFSYFSADNRIQGLAFFKMDNPCDDDLCRIRGILGSFGLEAD